MKVIISDLIQSPTLDCDGTSISRDNADMQTEQILTSTNALSPLFLTCPTLQQQLLRSEEIKQDEESKEYYTMVKFNSIEKFIPQDYYRMVHEDNNLFLFEK